MKNYKLLLLFAVFLSSCSKGYQQDYDDFENYSKTNVRNKSWFPKIIDSSAYHLKSVSYLDELAAFGTFRYSKAVNYDTIFNDLAKRIVFSEFEKNVNKQKEEVPSWFLHIKDADTSNFETIKIDRFYITREKQGKQVYFILTD
jgi:hypothetical protein